jgi:enoyl-CoA hydratase/carnithine racemase
MTYETLLYEVADEIATVTLNRPAKMNAFTAQMGEEIVAAFRAADADRAVRAIIFTGAGRSFCAGADIGGFADNIRRREQGPARAGSDAREHRESMLSFPPLMRTLRKPSIAAINGYALGVGATMTLPCDIRIMADDAKIGLIFARVGLMPELGSSYILPRIVGAARAAEMMLTGRNYGAIECREMGLVSAVVPPAELLAKARSIAEEIKQGSPSSLALIRRAIYQGLTGSLEHSMEFESFALEQCYASPEHKEYVSAFVEKRKPDLSKIRH